LELPKSVTCRGCGSCLQPRAVHSAAAVCAGQAAFGPAGRLR
jgi:hypothetical protein